MRKVVDANYLDDQKLDNYLRKCKSNKIIICEYALIEAHKGNFNKSFNISSKYLVRPRLWYQCLS